jgi:hypothetical protein
MDSYGGMKNEPIVASVADYATTSFTTLPARSVRR